jgi:hypothetical protein
MYTQLYRHETYHTYCPLEETKLVEEQNIHSQVSLSLLSSFIFYLRSTKNVSYFIY